jgi:hypothetical protein
MSEKKTRVFMENDVLNVLMCPICLKKKCKNKCEHKL